MTLKLIIFNVINSPFGYCFASFTRLISTQTFAGVCVILVDSTLTIVDGKDNRLIVFPVSGMRYPDDAIIIYLFFKRVVSGMWLKLRRDLIFGTTVRSHFNFQRRQFPGLKGWVWFEFEERLEILPLLTVVGDIRFRGVPDLGETG